MRLQKYLLSFILMQKKSIIRGENYMQKLIIRLFIGMLIFIVGVSYVYIEEEKSIIKIETEIKYNINESVKNLVKYIDENVKYIHMQFDSSDGVVCIHT